VLRWKERAVKHVGRKFLLHRVPLLVGWDRDEALACAEQVAATGCISCRCVGSGVGDDKLQGRLVRQRNLYFFAVAGGEEQIGDVRFGVLGADLHGLRVVYRGGGVNDRNPLIAFRLYPAL